MRITLPEFSLVVLVGATGSGKSTFARAHFRPTEILSSDFFRGLVSDDETDQSVSQDAFDVLHHVAARRLANGRLTVIDATNVQPRARHSLLDLARHFDAPPVAIVLDLPEDLCRGHNAARVDRPPVPEHVVTRHVDELRRCLDDLQGEGFRRVYVLRTSEEVEAATVEREPRQSGERGPGRRGASHRESGGEREVLIAQLHSPESEIASRAVEELRARGWLEDGSLQGAHLQGANLQGAWLARANLQHAWLMGADLRRANLYAAVLRGADLYKADLAGASLGAASFDGHTVLPDGTRWSPDASAALVRFTDPQHPDFYTLS